MNVGMKECKTGSQGSRGGESIPEKLVSRKPLEAGEDLTLEK